MWKPLLVAAFFYGPKILAEFTSAVDGLAVPFLLWGEVLFPISITFRGLVFSIA